MTGLMPATNYYFRAYASDGNEMVYGEDVVFTTASDYVLCITSFDGVVMKDSNPFFIDYPSEPVLTIINPHTGDIWQTGNTYTITWIKAGEQKPKVKIWLVREDRIVLRIDNSTPHNGSFTWTVPAGLEPHDDYFIRITTQDNKVMDDSDFFSIVN